MHVWLIPMAVLIFLAPAQAAILAYPPPYDPGNRDHYENLRAADLAWLQSQAALNTAPRLAREAARHTKDRAARRAMLAGLRAEQRRRETDIATLRGPRTARQEALIKQTVKDWADAARRAGHGGETLRLMRDLNGAGL